MFAYKCQILHPRRGKIIDVNMNCDEKWTATLQDAYFVDVSPGQDPVQAIAFAVVFDKWGESTGSNAASWLL